MHPRHQQAVTMTPSAAREAAAAAGVATAATGAAPGSLTTRRLIHEQHWNKGEEGKKDTCPYCSRKRALFWIRWLEAVVARNWFCRLTTNPSDVHADAPEGEATSSTAMLSRFICSTVRPCTRPVERCFCE